MKCHRCESDKTEHQLCGFWFCFHCIQWARDKGASYWRRLEKEYKTVSGGTLSRALRKGKVPRDDMAEQQF